MRMIGNGKKIVYHDICNYLLRSDVSIGAKGNYQSKHFDNDFLLRPKQKTKRV